MFLNRTYIRFVSPLRIALALAIGIAALGSPARAAVFGTVVPTDGHASDLALDERRGVLYIAAFTANRIDVMSTSDNTIGTFMSVPGHPGSLAISPDGRFLVVALYGNAADGTAAGNGLVVIDLNSGGRSTYGLPTPPLAVAFGIDGLALVLTTTDFLLFDPVSGKTQTVDTVANVTAKTLPVPAPTFPPEITAASMVALRDGTKIFGFTDHLLFSYKIDKNPQIVARIYTAAPPLGPRAISVNPDGSAFMAGWGLFGCGVGFLGDCGAGGPLVAQLPNFTGLLNVGSVGFQASTGTIYAEGSLSTPPPTPGNSQTVTLPDGRVITITDPNTPATPSSVPPALLVMDSDNLTVRERVQLPENLAGKSVFSSDESILYAISDSGVTVFNIAKMQAAPRVVATQEDVVFRGSFCDKRPITQTITIVDPNGGNVPFSICAKGSTTGCAVNGITISPQSGITPAKLQITVDPTALQLGTSAFTFELVSSFAVNMPAPPNNGDVETDYTPDVRSRIRVLVNNREPEYRGAFVNLPGKLVDILADPQRDRVYILRQDKNQLLVYNSTDFSLMATLRTSNTPTQMAITFDRQYLLVGHDNSQLAYVYDLNTLQPSAPIVFPFGHYPRSLAASGNAILGASRVAGPPNTIDRVDMVTRSATQMGSLGVYTNDIHIKTALTASPNGGTIFAAMPDGRVLLYNAGADTFTFARKDVTALQGAYAASSFGRYVVDRYILNDSLVQVGVLSSSSETASGSVFVDQSGFHTLGSAGAGSIRRFDTTNSLASKATTPIVEAPLSADANNPFIRTLAALYNQTAIVSLTISGFTVLPWTYDAAVAIPKLDRIVNAADLTSPVAPGGLVSIFGSQLSASNIAVSGIGSIGDSCLTVNGVVVPTIFVSSTQINAQLPYQIDGKASLVLRTPGGTSDGLNFTILPTAPAVFRTGTAGPDTGIANVYRGPSGDLVTVSNPVRAQDDITIVLTGMGNVSPSVIAGVPAPGDPEATPIVPATVTLGGVPLKVTFAGLLAGNIGVYQINASVPFKGIPSGFDIPLTITQGGSSTTLNIRVVD